MTDPTNPSNQSIYDTIQILPGLKPQHLQRLLLVSRSLGNTLDLPEILKMVIAAAADLTESEGASIMLVEPNGNELRFVASSDTSSNLYDLLVLEALFLSKKGESPSTLPYKLRHRRPLKKYQKASLCQIKLWINSINGY